MKRKAWADPSNSAESRAVLGVFLFIKLVGTWPAHADGNTANNAATVELAAYRAELHAFRGEFGGSYELPDTPFFLFGMGGRTKLLYKAGSLMNATTGQPLRQWPVKSATIVPPACCVVMVTAASEWVLGLKDPYDRNNSGETEADNLGQALYLISLVADKNHPLVAKVLKEMPRFEVDTPDGKYLKGRSDFSSHPVYQTKWAKYGLRALGLPDPYVVPRIEDSYSALFWMDYRNTYVKSQDARDLSYPYLDWACDHFHGRKHSPIGNRDYPLTWEKNASAANYAGMTIISDEYRQKRLAAPHAWHAAEIFLYLLEQKSK